MTIAERWNFQKNKSNERIQVENKKQKQQNEAIDNYIIQRQEINKMLLDKTEAEKIEKTLSTEIAAKIEKVFENL